MLERADAWGKHLFLEAEGDLVVHVHLGLYGDFLRAKAPAPEPRGAVRLRLENDRWYADLRGPTACDLLGPEGRDAILARLGPDPLRRDADPALVRRRITTQPRARRRACSWTSRCSRASATSTAPSCSSGTRSRRSPRDADLSGDVVDAMWQDLVVLMKDGVRRGRIVTVAPEDVAALAALDTDRPSSDDPDLDGGEDTPARRRRRRETGTYVYRRDGRSCLRCGSEIRAEEFQGRRLFWCPGCQTL